MTVKEAAIRLEVHQQTVYQLCRAHLLRHHRVGVGRGSIRIKESDLVAYLERVTVEATFDRPERAKINRPVIAPLPTPRERWGSDLDLSKALKGRQGEIESQGKKRPKGKKAGPRA